MNSQDARIAGHMLSTDQALSKPARRAEITRNLIRDALDGVEEYLPVKDIAELVGITQAKAWYAIDRLYADGEGCLLMEEVCPSKGNIAYTYKLKPAEQIQALATSAEIVKGSWL